MGNKTLFCIFATMLIVSAPALADPRIDFANNESDRCHIVVGDNAGQEMFVTPTRGYGAHVTRLPNGAVEGICEGYVKVSYPGYMSSKFGYNDTVQRCSEEGWTCNMVDGNNNNHATQDCEQRIRTYGVRSYEGTAIMHYVLQCYVGGGG